MSSRRALHVVLLLCAALVPAARSAQAGPNPVPPHVDRPLYTHDETGFEHFVQDQMPGLVAGQVWEWRGKRFEVVRLHRISEAKVVRPRKASRNREPGQRGWTVAIVHVRVDGKLMHGRVEATAGYAWEPGGWIWEQALLYLGGANSYDFVARKVV